MEGEPGRGFERLLRRLDAVTRARHCGAALDEELHAVLAHFRQCAQAMHHARQVDEATKSLISNASATADGKRVHFGSAAITQHLTEMHQLENAIQTMLQTLMEVAKDHLVTAVVVPVVVPSVAANVQAELHVKIEQEAETQPPRAEAQLLERMRSLLTEQHGRAWLSDALEAARGVVRALDPQEAAGSDVGHRDFSPEEQRIFEPVKLLRKAVLKHVATRPEEVATFRKVLKRLLKKRPVFSVFVERCEMQLAVKLAKAVNKPKAGVNTSKGEAKKPKGEAQAPSKKSTETETASPKSKKRKLSDSSETLPTAPPAPARAASASALADIRSKAKLCAVKAQALGDVFSLSAFDVCLKLMIDVVNALTPQFTGDDTASVSATLFLLTSAADKIKVQEKRRDRLVCLESLLSVLLSKERLPWDNTCTKKTAQDHLTKCRAAIEALRRPEFSAASTTPSPPPVASAPATKKKKKDKPAPSHKRFEEE